MAYEHDPVTLAFLELDTLIPSVQQPQIADRLRALSLSLKADTPEGQAWTAVQVERTAQAREKEAKRVAALADETEQVARFEGQTEAEKIDTANQVKVDQVDDLGGFGRGE